MNTASNNRRKTTPTGSPVGGNAARRAAFQSTAQLGRRFGVANTPAPAAPVAVATVAAPAVPLERVLATYNMFRAA